MKTGIALILCWLLSYPLLSCVSASTDAPAAIIAKNLSIALPTPQEFGRAVTVAQLITARHREETYRFEAQISISSDRLDLIGIDVFGRRALTLTATATGLAASRAPEFPDFIRPENVLADLAVIYWPADSLRRRLVGTGAVLRTEERRRSLLVGGREVIRVDYESAQEIAFAGVARYWNFDLGYELHLRSAAIAE